MITQTDKKVTVHKISYRILYLRYKKYFLPLGIIGVSIILLVVFIVPQINGLYFARAETEKLTAKVAVLKQNVQLLKNLGSEELENNVGVISAALPPEKDFVGIVQAIAQASRVSGVSVNDYDFALGDLSLASGKGASVQLISVGIIVNGKINLAQRFLAELAKTLPLSEATQVQIAGGQTSIKTQFYFKPPSDVTFDKEKVLKLLSAEDKATLGKLSNWRIITSDSVVLPDLPGPSVVSQPSGTQTTPTPGGPTGPVETDFGSDSIPF